MKFGTLKYLLLATVSFVLINCTSNTSIQTLTVLYTNDEHGWMEGTEQAAGAAELYALWERNEDYSPQGDFLILSGGDNWTGPAISTWVEGESMVEVMNAMNYDASAVGNHEFDFGLKVLETRISEANFPYLSANVFWRDNGADLSDIGIFPSTVKNVNGIRVGIIGLTTLSTPVTTRPKYVESILFSAYERSLRTAVRGIEEENADLIFVISHVCIDEIQQLAEQVADLNIQMMGAGHCNELVADSIGSTVILGGGSKFQTYAKASFDINRETRAVEGVNYSTHQNNRALANADISTLIKKWADQSQTELSVVLGFNSVDLLRNDSAFQQAIIDSWLVHDPSADIAITNRGGIREGLSAGQIEFGDIFNIMPFENSLVVAEVSGRTIKTALTQGSRALVAGLSNIQGQLILESTGEPIQDGRIYRVIINDFMYDGGDNFGAIAAEDPDAIVTGVPYRQPFIDWIISLSTTASNPLTL